MLPLLALFGLPLLPSSADLDRFPGYSMAGEQLDRCREHRRRLAHLQSVHGWQGGTWENALADLDHAETYWLWLLLAHTVGPSESTGRSLAELKRHVGPARYLRGWSPPLIPEAERFAPLWPALPAPVESREPSGVNAR